MKNYKTQTEGFRVAYTIKERQEIYEHLLTLDCPDLLASLIAHRADKTFMDCEASEYTSLLELITDAFFWEEAEEGLEFWFEIHECLDADEYDTPTVVDVIESTEQEVFDNCVSYSIGDKLEIDGVPCMITGVSTPDMDFESPTDGGTLILTSPSEMEFKVDSTVFKEEMQKLQEQFNKGVPPLSFWTKVKLFFGRWGYKV